MRRNHSIFERQHQAHTLPDHVSTCLIELYVNRTYIVITHYFIVVSRALYISRNEQSAGSADEIQWLLLRVVRQADLEHAGYAVPVRAATAANVSLQNNILRPEFVRNRMEMRSAHNLRRYAFEYLNFHPLLKFASSLCYHLRDLLSVVQFLYGHSVKSSIRITDSMRVIRCRSVRKSA